MFKSLFNKTRRTRIQFLLCFRHGVAGARKTLHERLEKMPGLAKALNLELATMPENKVPIPRQPLPDFFYSSWKRQCEWRLAFTAEADELGLSEWSLFLVPVSDNSIFRNLYIFLNCDSRRNWGDSQKDFNEESLSAVIKVCNDSLHFSLTFPKQYRPYHENQRIHLDVHGIRELRRLDAFLESCNIDMGGAELDRVMRCIVVPHQENNGYCRVSSNCKNFTLIRKIDMRLCYFTSILSDVTALSKHH